MTHENFGKRLQYRLPFFGHQYVEYNMVKFSHTLKYVSYIIER